MDKQKRNVNHHHVVVTEEADDDQRGILLEFLCHSLQQNPVEQQGLTPGWGQSVGQHLNTPTQRDRQMENM